MRFSVVIPTLARPEALGKTLANLLRCDPSPEEIIIVDADPERSGEARARRLDPGDARPAFRYLPSPPSLTLQRNRGIDVAEGDVLVFFDDDVSFPVDLFARLERAYEDPQVVGVTGQIVEPRPHRVGGVGSPLRRWLLGGVEEGRFTSFGYPRYVENPERVREVEYMLGCFMTARREQARRVRFDESLGGYALFEDEDFSYRLSHEGRIRYLPDLVVHHDKFGFTSKDPREFNRLVVRNRWYLFHKNFAGTRLAHLQFGLLLALLLGHRLMNREWRAAQGLLEGVASLWARRLGRR